MKRSLLPIAAVALIAVAGCGVNKEYVDTSVAEAESRMAAQIQAAEAKANNNEAEINRLMAAQDELRGQTEMALNQAAGLENYEILWTGTINFAFDSYDLNQTAEVILSEAGQKLQSEPKSILEIVGHTDGTGSSSYNLRLGQMRAEAAQRFVASRFDIMLPRLFILSRGEEAPVAMGEGSSSASENRRVNLTIWGIPSGM